MSSLFSIKPGQGAAELRLGMSRQDVVAVLGEPGSERAAGEETKWSFPAQDISVWLVDGRVTRLFFGERCEVTCGPLQMGMRLSEFPEKFTNVARRRERIGWDGQPEICFDVAGLTAFVTGSDQVLRGFMVLARETDGDQQEQLHRDPPDAAAPAGGEPDAADAPDIGKTIVVDTRMLMQGGLEGLGGLDGDGGGDPASLDPPEASAPLIGSDLDETDGADGAAAESSVAMPVPSASDELAVSAQESAAAAAAVQPAYHEDAPAAADTADGGGHAHAHGAEGNGSAVPLRQRPQVQGLREAIDGVVNQMRQASKATLRTVDVADVPSPDDRRPMPNGGELPINYLFQLSPGYGDERCHLEMSKEDIVYELGRPNGERDSAMRFTGRGMEVRFDKDGSILAITWCNEKSNRFLGPVRPSYVEVAGLRLGDPSADIREHIPEAAKYQDLDASTGIYQVPGLEIHHVRGEVVQFTVYHKTGRPAVLDED